MPHAASLRSSTPAARALKRNCRGATRAAASRLAPMGRLRFWSGLASGKRCGRRRRIRRRPRFTRSAWLTAVARMREELGGGSAVFLFGNGGCRFHQRLPFVRRVTGPKRTFLARATRRRSSAAATPLGRVRAQPERRRAGAVREPVGADCRRRGGGGRAGDDRGRASPHPYGALTDVSVCLVLRAVGVAHGRGKVFVVGTVHRTVLTTGDGLRRSPAP